MRARTPQPDRSDHAKPATPLQQLLNDHDIPSARVEAKLEEKLKTFNYPAPDRRQWHRWRLGKNTPHRKQMVWILWAVQQVLKDEGIRIDDLFDFDPKNAKNWPDRPPNSGRRQ